jgi:hypothetical protein
LVDRKKVHKRIEKMWISGFSLKDVGWEDVSHEMKKKNV